MKAVQFRTFGGPEVRKPAVHVAYALVPKALFRCAQAAASRTKRSQRQVIAWALIGFSTVFLSGAALADAADRADPVDTQAVGGKLASDRVERLSRQAFDFNRKLDRFVVGPVTHGYMRVTPFFVRERIGAVVQNLGEPRTVINDVSQGNHKLAGVAASRFLINSTLGGLGAFDVGQQIGLAPHKSDFDQTLGRYGVEPGTYFVMPVLGPMTPRDAVGRVVDALVDPITVVAKSADFNMARTGVSALDARASNDGLIRSLDDVIDPYAATQSAYTQRRAARVRAARGEAEILPEFDFPSPEDEKPVESTSDNGLS